MARGVRGLEVRRHATTARQGRPDHPTPEAGDAQHSRDVRRAQLPDHQSGLMTDTAGARLTRVRRRALAKPLIRRVEILRILFGLVWAIDAYLKWQPSFISSYTEDV